MKYIAIAKFVFVLMCLGMAQAQAAEGDGYAGSIVVSIFSGVKGVVTHVKQGVESVMGIPGKDAEAEVDSRERMQVALVGALKQIAPAMFAIQEAAPVETR